MSQIYLGHIIQRCLYFLLAASEKKAGTAGFEAIK